jgi:hypothetical protein
MIDTPRKNEIFIPAGEERQHVQNQTGLVFDVPTIDVPLPSMGSVYPEGHPLSGKTSVVISSMTAAQENILTNKSLAKKGTLLTQFVQSCLQDKKINAREMLMGDRSVIMIAARISGYGADYKFKVSCTECEEKSQQVFNLEKFPIRYLSLKPVENGMNLFEMTLPQTKAVVRFRFLTGADEEEFSVAQTQKKKIGPGVGDADIITSGLIQSVVSINGITDRNQIALAIPRMPAFDSKALRRFIQDNEPGMQLNGEMTCPSCNYTGEVSVSLGPEFFWPGSE